MRSEESLRLLARAILETNPVIECRTHGKGKGFDSCEGCSDAAILAVSIRPLCFFLQWAFLPTLYCLLSVN